tara:strand:- start:1641 stop:2552 length:912 start_codon:yes stop_codon:yes gene_type:complete
MKNLKNDFNENGFVVLENIFEKKEFIPVLNDINYLVDNLNDELIKNGKLKKSYKDEHISKKLISIEKDCPGASAWLHTRGRMTKEIAKLWCNDKLLDKVQQILGPNISGNPIWNIRCKVPNNNLATVPWHQDTAYLNKGAEKTLQIAAWIPLVDVNEKNGTLQVAPKYKDKVLNHNLEREKGNSKSWYLYINDSDFSNDTIYTCNFKVGTIILFNQIIPHRSLENHSDHTRWSLDLRWQRPDEYSGVDTTSCVPMRINGENQNFKDWIDAIDRNEFETADYESKKNEEGMYPDPVGPWIERWQ